MRSELEVWIQLKKQLLDDPRFIVGDWIDDVPVIDVFVKDFQSNVDEVKGYLAELVKDVATVERLYASSRSIRITMLSHVHKRCSNG